MKTGGMALYLNVARNFAPEEVYPNRELDLLGDEPGTFRLAPFRIGNLNALSAERRQTIRLYVGHFPLVACDVLGGEFRVITILRDPITRTISLLRQLSRTSDGSRPSLDEIYDRPQVYESLLHNHQTKIFSMTLEDDPKGYMQPITVDAHRLELAKANLATVEVVGLTEHYDRFVDDLSSRFGWELKRSARGNEAPAGSERVTTALRRRITEDNAIDIEFYEYARELVDSRSR
jgi:hypothetical protein